MNKYCVVAKKDLKSSEIKKKIIEKLNNIMEYNEEKPELVITVGGDGTILRAVQNYINQLETVHFVGIHTGTLGFYTDYKAEELDGFLNDIITDQYNITKTRLVEAEYNNNGESKIYFGLNEVRIESVHSTLVCDIKIDNEFLETFRGNGICVSSSSGSTAYNRSIGGSVIAPNIPVLQLSEIAGIHHNAYRSLQSSLILAGSQVVNIDLIVANRPILGVDQLTIEIDNIKHLKVRLSNKFVKFVNYKPLSFIDRIRKAFIN
jgi:Predicted sugar kinase